jgi:hypothetical protein
MLPPSPQNIERLPDEILCTIFRAVAAVYPKMGTSVSTMPLGQLALSHVSQHWKTVVLGDPLLWHSILFFTVRKHNLELCQLFLERSQQAALNIQAMVRSVEEEQTFASLFLPHIHRWGRMALVCEPSQLVICLSRWSIAPLLESLELRVSFGHNDQEAVNIPFLQGGAPTLRYLDCSSLYLDDQPLDFPSLQELLLGPYHFDDPPRDTFHSITSLVAPQLTRLVARKFAIRSPFRPPVPIQFDNLVQLELQIETLTLWEFMEHSRFPKLDSVTLTLRMDAQSFVFGGNPTPLSEVRNVVIGIDSTAPADHNDVASLTVLKLTQLFPNALTLETRPLTTLEEVILNGAVVGWPKLTSITANTASLDDVKRIVFDRRNHGYFTPLREFNLQTIQGPCPREDYTYVSQNVDFHVQLAKKPNKSGLSEIASLSRFSINRLGGPGQL